MPAPEVATGAGCVLFVWLWRWWGSVRIVQLKKCVSESGPQCGAEVCSPWGTDVKRAIDSLQLWQVCGDEEERAGAAPPWGLQ